jgi:molybdate transport system substrate-binding protein
VRRLVLLAVLVAVAAVGVRAATASPVTVFAAASLTDVLPRIDSGARYSFGGSNTLAAQIGQGAPADVFAAADTSLPRRLHARGLVEKPVVFARNRLVLIVPRANPRRIHSVYDLRARGVRLVVAGAAVPVGAYTRKALARIHLGGVLRNVVSEEPDVRGVLAKVALGEADAGFVYSTDARTAPGKVRVLALPAAAQPTIAYALAVVTASGKQSAAKAFVQRVLSKAGQERLTAAGFLARR